mgnify:CR=1 FL=1
MAPQQSKAESLDASQPFINKISVVQRPNHVVVHPLVLLSVVDHYRRAAMNTKRRVVGVLLGNWVGQTVNITNSYASKNRRIFWERVLYLVSSSI